MNFQQSHAWSTPEDTENIILRDCNVACLQLFPGFRVIGPQIMHVCDVSGPESLLFDLVKGKEQLAQLLSGLKMEC